MKQDFFSNQVVEYLSEYYPEFIPTIKKHDDSSFDYDAKSPSGHFSIWIATYNSEITLGLESPDGKTDIHMHIRCDEIDDLGECLKELGLAVDRIKENKLILYKKDATTYDWIEKSKLLEREKTSGKKFEKYFWNSDTENTGT